MKVLSISNNYNSRIQSFKGLWGATTKNTDIDPTLGVNIVSVTSYYYPFLGESKESIKAIAESQSKAQIETVEGSQKPNYVINECKICSTIPFTQEDFDNYYSETNPSSRFTRNKQRLHAYVHRKFLNSDYEHQKSASNEIFAEKARKKLFDTRA